MLLSTKELAEKWGVNQSRVVRLAREGRIEGAVLFGNNWMFPQDAKKPVDGRTKSARAAKNARNLRNAFRFPLLVNFEEGAYSPALSDEERQLRQGQLAFYACRLDEAKELLNPLSTTAKSHYVRIAALYHRCHLALVDNNPHFDALLQEMNTLLNQDDPYRREMLLFRYAFDADFAYYESSLTEFCVDPEYTYHPTAYYAMAVQSFIPIENGDFSLLSKLRYDTYELLCQQMEREGYFLEAQMLHFWLLMLYQLQDDNRRMLFHARRGLAIAQDREFYWHAAVNSVYYPSAMNEALREFPHDFGKKVKSLGRTLHDKTARFGRGRENPSYLDLLSEKEYELAFLANQERTNREIAHDLHISEKTVSRIYGNIYAKLGINSKQELVNLINNTHSSGHF